MGVFAKQLIDSKTFSHLASFYEVIPSLTISHVERILDLNKASPGGDAVISRFNQDELVLGNVRMTIYENDLKSVQ